MGEAAKVQALADATLQIQAHTAVVSNQPEAALAV